MDIIEWEGCNIMSKPTRRKVMLSGMTKRGKKNILELGENTYKISNELAKRIRIKNILLVFEVFILTFIYFFSIEKYRDIPFNGIDENLLDGLNITFVFMFIVVALFIITSHLLLPKDIEEHIMEEIK